MQKKATETLPPHQDPPSKLPRWGNDVPGRPSGCRPPIRPSHAPSIRALGVGHRENERGFPHQQGGGRPAGPHRPALAHAPARPAQPSARPPWAAGSFSDKSSFEPKPNTFNATCGKMPGEAATRGKTSRSNFLGPSAPAGALWVVSQKRKETLVKMIGPAGSPPC